MKKLKIIRLHHLIVMLSLFITSGASADDMSDVQNLINKYVGSQTLENMNTQAELMANDRTYIVNGTRYSNNEISMALQTAGNSVTRKASPGIKRISTAEDVNIRLNFN